MHQLSLIPAPDLCPECCGDPVACECEGTIPRGKWDARREGTVTIEHPAFADVPNVLSWRSR